MLIQSLGIWFRHRARRRRPALAPDIVFIVGAEYQLVVLFVVIVRAVTFREARHGPHRPDRIAPAGARVKVLVQAAEVVFRRSREAREPCM